MSSRSVSESQVGDVCGCAMFSCNSFMMKKIFLRHLETRVNFEKHEVTSAIARSDFNVGTNDANVGKAGSIEINKATQKVFLDLSDGLALVSKKFDESSKVAR